MEEKKKLNQLEPPQDEEITLCQCYSCKNNYMEELTHPVKIKEPFQESYIYVKRYLCDTCYERLKQVKFVQCSEKELKNIKKENNKKEVEEDEE